VSDANIEGRMLSRWHDYTCWGDAHYRRSNSREHTDTEHEPKEEDDTTNYFRDAHNHSFCDAGVSIVPMAIASLMDSVCLPEAVARQTPSPSHSPHHHYSYRLWGQSPADRFVCRTRLGRPQDRYSPPDYHH